MLDEVKQVLDSHGEACDRLLEIVKEKYPVGRLIYVELGGHRLVIEITGYGWNYSRRPGEILGINYSTNKKRTFYLDDIVGD